MFRSGPTPYLLNLLACLALVFGGAGGTLTSLFTNEEVEAGQKEKEERSEGGEESPTEAIEGDPAPGGKPSRTGQTARGEPVALCQFRATARAPLGPPPDAWARPRRC